MTIEKQLEYAVYTQEGSIDSTKAISLKVSETKGMYIVHRALVKELSNKRQGTASTKTRSEVRGGGRKPWKQKGTGRARVGSTRSPLWRGGGVIFGPKPRSYSKKINKKEKQLALRTLLHNRQKDTLVIQDIYSQMEKPSTKAVLQSLQSLQVDIKAKILIIVSIKRPNLYLSIRNLQNIEIIAADQINIISILKADKIIMTSDAVDKIQEVYNGPN